jgi:hypothetical protein
LGQFSNIFKPRILKVLPCKSIFIAIHHVSPSRQLFHNAQSILHQEIGFSIVNQL